MIRVLFAGRIKADFAKEACELYLPRLRRYETEIIYNPRPGSAAEEERFFLKRIKPGGRGVALDPGGQALDSLGFAALMARLGGAQLLIGGAEGLSEPVRAACRERVSLSPLTLSHELALVVLLEQLYRAETLATGHPYHK